MGGGADLTVRVALGEGVEPAAHYSHDVRKSRRRLGQYACTGHFLKTTCAELEWARQVKSYQLAHSSYTSSQIPSIGPQQ